MGHSGCRGVPVGHVEHDGDAVGGEHLEGGGGGRCGQGVGVGTQIQRPVGALGRAELADGLGDGQDVVPVEGCVQAGSAMTGGAEDHHLARIGDVGVEVFVRRQKCIHVDEI